MKNQIPLEDAKQIGSRPLVIGLIGGIGSGKSHAAAVFAQRGAHVIAADELGHEALHQPAIRAQVVDRWGARVLDAKGEVDRKKLGSIVFAAPAERQALEAMVFPWIERRLQEEVQTARNDSQCQLVVLDAAIMLETGWNRVCDKLIFVDAPRTQRLQRLAKQRGWTEEKLAAREKAQMPLEEKRLQADYVLDNSGAPEQLARQVDNLLRRWRSERPSA